jgi:hypothetical protein
MSDSPHDVLLAFARDLYNAFIDERDADALDIINAILTYKIELNPDYANNGKCIRLRALTEDKVTRWRVKYGATPNPDRKIKIEANPTMAADLENVLSMKCYMCVNGDTVSVNTSAGTYMLNVFYLKQLKLTARQSSEITAILRCYNIESPGEVCKSLTTLVDGTLTYLESLKEQHRLPESLLPLCATIAKINVSTTECSTVYSRSRTLEGTRIALTCKNHTEITYDDSINALVCAQFAYFIEYMAKNAADNANFNQMMQDMQHLPSVDDMTYMIRTKSIHLTTHFVPVVKWLKRARKLYDLDNNTAFVQSFIGQVVNTGNGYICKPYDFLRNNFMDCVTDAAKEHSGDGIAMMNAIIKMMDTRLNPRNYRKTETFDSEGNIKAKHLERVETGAKLLESVTNHIASGAKLDSVKFGPKKKTDAGSVLAEELLKTGGGSKPGPKKGLSRSTFGSLGQSAVDMFKDLQGNVVGIEAIMAFIRKNPTAKVRVNIGVDRYLVAVGWVGGAPELFKDPYLIKYYKDAKAESFGIVSNLEEYELMMITRVVCNGKVNYVLTPVGARPVDPIQHVMLTEYVVDSKQQDLSATITALNKMMMSTEAEDPVIGFGIQTGAQPLGERWYACHSVPLFKITLNGVTKTCSVLPQ